MLDSSYNRERPFQGTSMFCNLLWYCLWAWGWWALCKNTYFPTSPIIPNKIRSPSQGHLQEFDGSPSLSALLQTSGMPELMEKEKGSPGGIISSYSQLCFTFPCTLEAYKLSYSASCFQDTSTLPYQWNVLDSQVLCTVTSWHLLYKTPVHHRPLLMLSFHWQKCH